jgi:hypothetical protein
VCVYIHTYIYIHKRLVGKPEERNHLETHGGYGIILKQILRNLCVRVWSGLMWLRIRSSEHDNEPSGFSVQGIS